MNLLNKIEEYIKRPKLGEVMEVSYGYLANLSRHKQISDKTADKIKDAVKEIIAELEKALK